MKAVERLVIVVLISHREISALDSSMQRELLSLSFRQSTSICLGLQTSKWFTKWRQDFWWER